MIVDLNDAKNFLRVDFTDDDTLIQGLIDTSTEYLNKAIGFQYDSTEPRAVTIVLLMVAELYTNREIARQLDAGANSVLNSLITQLAMSSDQWDLQIGLQVPVGLTALSETGDVRLRWLANLEPNVDGYNVYRDDVKLNTQDLVRESSNWMRWPLAWGDWPYPMWQSKRHPGPGVMQFRDQTVTAGTTYSYTVTVVDKLGNESKSSAAASITA